MRTGTCPTWWTKWREAKRRSTSCSPAKKPTLRSAPSVLDKGGVTAFISIMRGCDNMCSFCVVPFTRGRERSRDPQSIVREAQELFDAGYREVTLLGQNVDSYKWNIDNKGVVKDEGQPVVRFAELLEMVAAVHPDLRVRFSTSHPKDMTDDVLHAMSRHENICKYIHLPVQSGHSDVLKRMNRGYTREWYLDRIEAIRRIMPGCAISTDVITGFCGETEEEHQATLSLMDEVRYDMAFMFKYSERPKTLGRTQSSKTTCRKRSRAPACKKSSPDKWCTARSAPRPRWGRCIAF